jgi:hypothetical protein
MLERASPEEAAAALEIINRKLGVDSMNWAGSQISQDPKVDKMIELLERIATGSETDPMATVPLSNPQ